MIRLTKPEVSGALEDLGKLLDEGFLVQGERVREFEAELAGYVGRRYGLAVSSGTAAIQCALMGLGIGEGDEVAIPDFTFPATANAVVLSGARPVLVDIDRTTFNMDPVALESLPGEKLRAVMPVHLFGLAADLGAIEGFCKRRGLMLVEDSACALGASYGGRRCGSFGEASALSFHPRKVVTTGEGGMVLADSEAASERVRELRNHGIRSSGGQAEFVAAGFNFRMTEMAAVLGLIQMKHIDGMIEKRRHVAASYDELFKDIADVAGPVEPEDCFHTYQSYVIMLGDGVDRDLVIRLLRRRGVESTIGTYSVHVQPYYRKLLGHKAGYFPHSLKAMKQSLALPMYPSMTAEEIGQVADALKGSIAEAATGK